MTTTSHTEAELSQARAALARARRTNVDARTITHLQGIVGNLSLLARTGR